MRTPWARVARERITEKLGLAVSERGTDVLSRLSFVDHDGHSISSKGFLPTVVCGRSVLAAKNRAAEGQLTTQKRGQEELHHVRGRGGGLEELPHV